MDKTLLKKVATLALNKVAISATCDENSQIGKVEHTESKALSATQKGLHTIVCSGITDDDNHIAENSQLSRLLAKLQTHSDSLYGHDFPIPSVIDSSQMYQSHNYHPLQQLNKQVNDLITNNTKPHGLYILIEADAYSSKSFWLKEAIEQNLAHHTTLIQPPKIDGYFFARRYASAKNINADSYDVQYISDYTYTNEYHALQSVISTARKNRQVTVDTDSDVPVQLYQGNYERDATSEKTLYNNFDKALTHIAETTATRDNPLILAIDGLDELFGMGENAYNVRKSFPKFPDELPPHTYFIILSRAGSHLSGMAKEGERGHVIELDILKNPALQQDVELYFDRVLNNTPDTQNHAKLQSFDYANIFDITQKKAIAELKPKLIEASDGAFGYIPYTLRYLSQNIDMIETWRSGSQPLPKGVYGIRARELLGLYADIEAHYPTIYRDFVLAVASLSKTKAPLSAKDVAHLFFKGAKEQNQRELLIKALTQNSICFDNRHDSENAPLVFNHKTMAELTFAFADLYIRDSSITLAIEEHSTKLAHHAQALESGNTTAYEGTLFAINDRLSQNLTKVMRQLEKVDSKPIAIYPASENHLRYVTLWGVYHFIMARVTWDEDDLADDGEEIRKVFALLHNAGYLQTIIRTSRDEQSKNAIRETYIQADKLEPYHDYQSLHWKIESQLLQWHDSLIKDEVTVGGLLWNMLGAWQQGQEFAEQWKASIDIEAIICQQAGTPPDFDRMIDGYSQSAMTECGSWLVTSGVKGTAVWDLRDGVHRAILVVQLAQEFGDISIEIMDKYLYVFFCSESGYLYRISVLNFEVRTLMFFIHPYFLSGGCQIKISQNAIIITTIFKNVIYLKKLNIDIFEEDLYQSYQQYYHGRMLRFYGHENQISKLCIRTTDNNIYIVSVTFNGFFGFLNLSYSEYDNLDKTNHGHNGFILRLKGNGNYDKNIDHGDFERVLDDFIQQDILCSCKCLDFFIHKNKIYIATSLQGYDINLVSIDLAQYRQFKINRCFKVLENRISSYEQHTSAIVKVKFFLIKNELYLYSTTNEGVVGFQKINSLYKSLIDKKEFSNKIKIFPNYNKFFGMIYNHDEDANYSQLIFGNEKMIQILPQGVYDIVLKKDNRNTLKVKKYKAKNVNTLVENTRKLKIEFKTNAVFIAFITNENEIAVGKLSTNDFYKNIENFFENVIKNKCLSFSTNCNKIRDFQLIIKDEKVFIIIIPCLNDRTIEFLQIDFSELLSLESKKEKIIEDRFTSILLPSSAWCFHCIIRDDNIIINIGDSNNIVSLILLNTKSCIDLSQRYGKLINYKGHEDRVEHVKCTNLENGFIVSSNSSNQIGFSFIHELYLDNLKKSYQVEFFLWTYGEIISHKVIALNNNQLIFGVNYGHRFLILYLRESDLHKIRGNTKSKLLISNYIHYNIQIDVDDYDLLVDKEDLKIKLVSYNNNTLKEFRIKITQLEQLRINKLSSINLIDKFESLISENVINEWQEDYSYVIETKTNDIFCANERFACLSNASQKKIISPIYWYNFEINQIKIFEKQSFVVFGIQNSDFVRYSFKEINKNIQSK